MPRSVSHRILAVCALVFCAELGQAMLFPLLPELSRTLGLGPARTGVLLSLATFATLATAVPAGMLAERVGALRVSLAAGLLFVVAAAVQALATDFAAFLAGRALFGVGFAAIWTAGVTLVSGPGAPRWAVGATMAAGGLAHLVGPPVSGVLGEAAGRSLPFWLLAGCAAAVTLFAASASAGPGEPRSAAGLRAAACAARHDPGLRGAVVLIALVGALTGLVPLAVPLLLDRAGFSGGEIGVVFAAGSALWVVASALAGRLGARAGTIGAAAAGLLILAAVALLPVVSVAAPCIIVFVLVRSAIQAPLSTLSYQLGAGGARTAGVAVGTALGMLNLVWALGATVAPLAGGVLLDGAGPRWVFVLLALACVASGVALRRAAAGRGRGVATATPARALPAGTG